MKELALSRINYGKNIIIKSEDDMKDAVALLSELNKLNDELIRDKEKVTAPLNEALAAERARFKPFEIKYKEAINYVRKEMSRYQTDKMKSAALTEAEIVSRVGDGSLKPEEAAQKIGVLSTKKHETPSGSVTFKETKILKITNEKKIPDKYWVIDRQTLEGDLKAGKKVPGASLEIIQTPVNRRS